VKNFLIILAAVIVFGGLVLLKIHLSADAVKKEVTDKKADIVLLEKNVRADSLYNVKDFLYKDSGIMIAVDNPGKSGTENYFDKKYKLNEYSNINMVYIYPYDSLKPLQQASFDEAIMAKGKKMGRFEETWITRFIDTTDGSCRPLKKWLQDSLKYAGTFSNQETNYQPESIYKMRVVFKFKSTDSAGVKSLNDISAVVDTGGRVSAVEKTQ
jgi:hypothetical protein